MKTKVLFYCTKGKPYLFNRIIKGESDGYYTDIVPYDIEDEYLCGKIVCECEVECEEIKYKYENNQDIYYINSMPKDLVKKSCIRQTQLFDYLDGMIGKNIGYALHISNLKVFDEPLELGELVRSCLNDNCLKCKNFDSHSFCPTRFKKIEKAPQNMMWVWYKCERYCLISIRPEWLCKILNGEKTIEVRKKILKGMM